MDPLPPTQSVVQDRTHPQSPQPPSSEAGWYTKDKEDHQEAHQPSKEIPSFEQDIRMMGDESLYGQPTLEESSESSYQSFGSDTDEPEQNFDELFQEWKEMGKVLSNLRAKHQPVGQLNDVDLIRSAERLKYNISNLSQQWPRGNTPREAEYLHHLQSTTPESSGYRVLLKDDNRQPQIIEAFIWRVLTCKVFGGFHWAGRRASPNIRGLKKYLAASSELGSPEGSEVQVWTSRTTQLLLKALDTQNHDKKQEAVDHVERLKRGIISPILEAVGLHPNSNEGIVRQLDDILNDALALDQTMSQQVAKWEWEHLFERDCKGGMAFDEELMQRDEGESFSSKRRRKRAAKLVISPALVKRGNSDGENYDVETIGMRMVVSCKGF
ncbi:hypothetical protein ACHAPT_011950 [Fusarium lateritium]